MLSSSFAIDPILGGFSSDPVAHESIALHKLCAVQLFKFGYLIPSYVGFCSCLLGGNSVLEELVCVAVMTKRLLHTLFQLRTKTDDFICA